MKLIILGRPISKKNSREIGFRGGRIMNRPSGAYEQFRKDALKQIVFGGKPIEPPYRIVCEFYLKGKMYADIDNLFSGILDILQEKGVLTNDKEVFSIEARKYQGHKDWKTIVWIYTYETDTEKTA